MMTQEKIQRAAVFFAKRYWGLDFDMEVYINPRTSRRLGCVKSRKNFNGTYTPIQFELSKKLVQQYDKKGVFDVLKHELCHWALITMNYSGFRDGDHEFESELRRIGASSTRKELNGKKRANAPKETYHVTACSNCGKTINKFKREATARNRGKGYISGCCDAELVYGGTVQE